MHLAVEDALHPGFVANGLDVLHFQAGDHPRAIQQRDRLRAGPVLRCRAFHFLKLEGIRSAIHAQMPSDVRLRGGEVEAGTAADGVQIVQRPEVEQVDVVAAVHPRADPSRQALVTDAALFHVQVAQGELGVEVAVVVKQRPGDGQRGDDPRREPGLPVVVAAQLELGVGPFIDARAVGDHVGVAAFTAASVRGDHHAAVGAEGEAALREIPAWAASGLGGASSRHDAAARRHPAPWAPARRGAAPRAAPPAPAPAGVRALPAQPAPARDAARCRARHPPLGPRPGRKGPGRSGKPARQPLDAWPGSSSPLTLRQRRKRASCHPTA